MYGKGPRCPPGMGGVAPLVEWFEAVAPLQTTHYAQPPFVFVLSFCPATRSLQAPVRLDALVMVFQTSFENG